MADVILPLGYPGAFNALLAIPTDEIAQLVIHLSRAIDKLAAEDEDKVDVLGLYMYIPQIRGIFRNGKYDPVLGQKFVNRIKAISPGLIKEWQHAMAATTSENTDRVNAMLQLMQCEPLWIGVNWNDQGAKNAISRLRSIPPTALKEWSRVSSSKSMVALSLVNTDTLFRGDVFNASLFQQAVPIALKIYEERAAKLK